MKNNTEVTFVCSDEKAVFMLKASRMFDGGYRDFIDGKRVIERLEEQKEQYGRRSKENEGINIRVSLSEKYYAKECSYNHAIEIVKDEVR